MALTLAGCSGTLAGCSGSALDRNPSQPGLRVAEIALSAGSPRMALQVAQGILSHTPNDVGALLVRGDALTQLGLNDDAALAFERVLTADPASVHAKIGLGRVRLTTDPGAAVALFQDVLKQDELQVNALTDLGIGLDLLGRHTEAQVAYRRVRILNPDNVAAQVNLALSLAMNHDGDDALTVIEPLANQPDASPRVRHNYAAVLAMAGREADAAVVLRQDMAPAAVDEALFAYRQARIGAAPGAPETAIAAVTPPRAPIARTLAIAPPRAEPAAAKAPEKLAAAAGPPPVPRQMAAPATAARAAVAPVAVAPVAVAPPPAPVAAPVAVSVIPAPMAVASVAVAPPPAPVAAPVAVSVIPAPMAVTPVAVAPSPAPVAVAPVAVTPVAVTPVAVAPPPAPVAVAPTVIVARLDPPLPVVHAPRGAQVADAVPPPPRKPILPMPVVQYPTELSAPAAASTPPAFGGSSGVVMHVPARPFAADAPLSLEPAAYEIISPATLPGLVVHVRSAALDRDTPLALTQPDSDTFGLPPLSSYVVERAEAPAPDGPAIRPSAIHSDTETASPMTVAMARPVEPEPVTTHSAIQVQMGAFPTEESAQAEWHRLVSELPSLLRHRQPTISRITHDGTVFWRLRTDGFADLDAAHDFCTQLRPSSARCLALGL